MKTECKTHERADRNRKTTAHNFLCYERILYLALFLSTATDWRPTQQRLITNLTPPTNPFD